MARRNEKHREAGRAAVELLVRYCAPGARIFWDGNDLRVEGVERSAFDELSQQLWYQRNALVHISPDGKNESALASVFNRVTLIEPEELEFRWRTAALNRAADRVAQVFNFIELMVPRRIADEEIGDALEMIDRLMREGRPTWQIYLKALTAAFFVVLNTVREVTSSLLGKKDKA